MGGKCGHRPGYPEGFSKINSQGIAEPRAVLADALNVRGRVGANRALRASCEENAFHPEGDEYDALSIFHRIACARSTRVTHDVERTMLPIQAWHVREALMRRGGLPHTQRRRRRRSWDRFCIFTLATDAAVLARAQVGDLV
jgi:hypothetical protein